MNTNPNPTYTAAQATKWVRDEFLGNGLDFNMAVATVASQLGVDTLDLLSRVDYKEATAN